MKTLDTRAVPVARRPLSGVDRLYTLITPDHGRVLAVARRAALPRGALGPPLEPFGICRVVLEPGRSRGLWRVLDVDRLRWFGGIGADLPRMRAAGLVCAWARALGREGSEPRAYRALVWALTALNRLGRPPAPIVAAYLWGMAGVAGVAPEPGRCAVCGALSHLDDSARVTPVALRIHAGGMACGRCATDRDVALSAPALHTLSHLCRGHTRGLDEDHCRRQVALAQTYLRAHFGSSLPRSGGEVGSMRPA